MAQERQVQVAVIGAGQAGLIAAYHLRRRGLDAAGDLVVLDAATGPGGAWRDRWDSLTVDAAHRIHPLPGLDPPDWPPGTPATKAMEAYFGEYETRFALPVHRPQWVDAVRATVDGLAVEAEGPTGARQVWNASIVVNATGTWTAPFVPYYPGRERFAGRQLHTADFLSAAEFAGQQVVVVGGGNSAVQLLAQIAAVTSVTWVTRREPQWRQGPFDEEAGRAAEAAVAERVAAGLPPGSVVSVTGLGLTPQVQAARDAGWLVRQPMFASISEKGVTWADGRFQAADVILWCTGFRAALRHLRSLHLREPGGGIRLNGTATVCEPRLHLIGYGPSASTVGASRAGRQVARAVLAQL